MKPFCCLAFLFLFFFHSVQSCCESTSIDYAEKNCLCGQCGSSTSCPSQCTFPQTTQFQYRRDCDGGWNSLNSCELVCPPIADICSSPANFQCSSVTRLTYSNTTYIFYQCAVYNNTIPECADGSDEPLLSTLGTCGDGIVQRNLYESCDDGSSNSVNGCASNCTIKPFSYCSFRENCINNQVKLTSSCQVVTDSSDGGGFSFIPSEITISLDTFQNIISLNQSNYASMTTTFQNALKSTISTALNVQSSEVQIDGFQTSPTINYCSNSANLESATVKALKIQFHLNILPESSSQVSTSLNSLNFTQLIKNLSSSFDPSNTNKLSLTNYTNPQVIQPKDVTAPTAVAEIKVFGNPFSSCYAGIGSKIVLSILASETITLQQIAWSIGAVNAVANITGSGENWTVEFNVYSDSVYDGLLTFEFLMTDLSGNSAFLGDITNCISIDTRIPAISKNSVIDFSEKYERTYNISFILGDSDFIVVNTSLIRVTCSGCEGQTRSIEVSKYKTRFNSYVTITYDITKYKTNGEIRVQFLDSASINLYNYRSKSQEFIVVLESPNSLSVGAFGAMIALACLISLFLIAIFFTYNNSEIIPVPKTANSVIIVSSISCCIGMISIPMGGLQKLDTDQETRDMACLITPHFIAFPFIYSFAILAERNFLLTSQFIEFRDLRFSHVSGLIAFILTLIWSLVGESKSILSSNRTWTCTYPSPNFILLWAVFAIFIFYIILTIATYQKILSQPASDITSAAKNIRFVMYNYALLGCVAIPIAVLVSNPTAWFLTISVAICLVAGSTLGRFAQMGISVYREIRQSSQAVEMGNK